MNSVFEWIDKKINFESIGKELLKIGSGVVGTTILGPYIPLAAGGIIAGALAYTLVEYLLDDRKGSLEKYANRFNTLLIGGCVGQIAGGVLGKYFGVVLDKIGEVIPGSQRLPVLKLIVTRLHELCKWVLESDLPLEQKKYLFTIIGPFVRQLIEKIPDMIHGKLLEELLGREFAKRLADKLTQLQCTKFLKNERLDQELLDLIEWLKNILDKGPKPA